MSEQTKVGVPDIELVSSWEGPAEHAPGVLFEVSRGEGTLGGDPALVDLAAWVALAALSGAIGNTDYEEIKTKVRGVLTAWRRQEGQARLNELKRQVFEVMQKHRTNGTLTEEKLEERIDAFFREIREG